MRWGIISTGTIAKKFAETINKMQGEAVLAGVASRSLEKARDFATFHGAAAYYSSYEELVQSSDIDIVYIATPNVFHYENTLLCLNAGKHVLCEKPFTTNASDAKKLYAMAREKGLFIMDGLWTMHLPMYAKIRQLISEGAIGEVKHVRADFGFVATGARKDMKLDSSLGGGALLDIGVYNIGFAAMVFGANPTSIQAHLNINEYGTDDFGTVILTYPGNRTATLTSAIGIQMPTEGVIYGTKGRLHLPSYLHAQRMNLYAVGSEEPVIFELPFDINGFEYQIREAMRCIKGSLKESSQLTEAFSIGIIQTLDDIRKMAGLRFSFE